MGSECKKYTRNLSGLVVMNYIWMGGGCSVEQSYRVDETGLSVDNIRLPMM